jgi:hypothetical protein
MRTEGHNDLLHIPEQYSVAMRPYQDCISQMLPAAATSFVLHDFSNFATLISARIDRSPLRGLNMKTLESTQAGLATLKPLSQTEGSDIDQALPAYLLALIGSHDFLHSLYVDGAAKQMSALRYLHALRAPLRPIAALKYGDIMVTNGQIHEVEQEVELNGLEFIVAYNLFENAKKYGQRINGSKIKGFMHFNAANHDMHMFNFSTDRPPEDPLSQFSRDHFGLFIASMYACLLGKTLSTMSYALMKRNGEPDRYLVEVVVSGNTSENKSTSLTEVDLST